MDFHFFRKAKRGVRRLLLRISGITYALDYWIKSTIAEISKLEAGKTIYFRFFKASLSKHSVICCYTSISGYSTCQDQDLGSIAVQGKKTWDRAWPIIEERINMLAKHVDGDASDWRIFRVTATPQNERGDIAPNCRPFLLGIHIALKRDALHERITQPLAHPHDPDTDTNHGCGCSPACILETSPTGSTLRELLHRRAEESKSSGATHADCSCGGGCCDCHD